MGASINTVFVHRTGRCTPRHFHAVGGIPQGKSGECVWQGASAKATRLRLTYGKELFEYLGGRDRGAGQNRHHQGQLCGIGRNDAGDAESKSGQLE